MQAQVGPEKAPKSRGGVEPHYFYVSRPFVEGPLMKSSPKQQHCCGKEGYGE